ncbi:MAG: hypothetical protein KGQ46_13190 [Hyphomicrobiales bacterium]|nr:hypothetical protein [Hyphomicrobiales bacterium]MDE2113890.1 hypothetical protein [Hyphomicrobiales bacterium]
MLLPDTLRRLSAHLRPIAALAACTALAGCFQPLYGSLNGGLASKLQTIAVDPIPDMIGHYLGNDLIFDLNGTGSTVTPQYHLKVQLVEAVSTPLVNSYSGIATSATVNVRANYTLTEAGSTKVVFKGTAVNIVTYDRSNQGFANLRAGRDAEIRNAKVLSDQIRTQIAAFFANGG